MIKNTSLKKGSFQVSLSMIIGVVFAVVILGLAISWITGSFSGITKISDRALASAKASLQQGVVDKSLLLFGKEKIRVDKSVEGAVVVRNKLYEKAFFKVDITSPQYNSQDMFEIVGKEGILEIPPDEIKEHTFSISGNVDVLKSYLGDKNEKAVRFEYSIYYCDKDKVEQCTSNDWQYYDSGNTLLTILSQS